MKIKYLFCINLYFSHLVFQHRRISFTEAEAHGRCPLRFSSERFITKHHAFLEGVIKSELSTPCTKRKLTSLNKDIIGSFRLPNLNLTEGDLIAFCSTSLSISFSCLQRHIYTSLICTITQNSLTLLINGTSGSLRLPNLSRNDGERTALRSI